MNPAFKQIGNAVPPLFAYAIAMALRTALVAPSVRDIRVELLGLTPEMITTTEGRG
jgi:DNA (cytosine-5)-methyltransferase 1